MVAQETIDCVRFKVLKSSAISIWEKYNFILSIQKKMQFIIDNKVYPVITTKDDPTNRLRTQCLDIAPWEFEDYAVLLRWLFQIVWKDKKISGVALPQIGICKKGFVINGKDKTGKICQKIVINPSIISTSAPQTAEYESCLSEPWVKKMTKRDYIVRAVFQDASGKVQEEIFTGYWSRVFQHEYDHLQGILLSDK